MDTIHTLHCKNVYLVCLPPNLTHIMQPLDVSVFYPLKQAYSKILKEYKTATLAAKLSQKQYFQHFFVSYGICLSSQVTFVLATGIHPLKQEEFLDEKLKTGNHQKTKHLAHLLLHLPP